MIKKLDLKEVKSEIKSFNEKIAEFKKAQQELVTSIGQKPFIEAFNELHEIVPEIESVSWAQYTPHWNDGEECTFSVHERTYRTVLDEEFEHDPEPEYGLFDNLKTDKEIFVMEEDLVQRKVEYQKKSDAMAKNWVYDPRNPWDKTAPRPYNTYEYLERDIKTAKALREKFDNERIYKIKKAIKDFEELIHSVPSEIMQGIFDDHVEVTLSTEGCNVEEYGHD